MFNSTRLTKHWIFLLFFLLKYEICQFFRYYGQICDQNFPKFPKLMNARRGRIIKICQSTVLKKSHFLCWATPWSMNRTLGINWTGFQHYPPLVLSGALAVPVCQSAGLTVEHGFPSSIIRIRKLLLLNIQGQGWRGQDLACTSTENEIISNNVLT